MARHHGDWTLVFLHGRTASPSSTLSQSFFDALHGLGSRAPVVVLLDGGDHSYWHNRADGAGARWCSTGQHVWPGGHDSSYWHSHMRQYLAFYAAHCA